MKMFGVEGSSIMFSFEALGQNMMSGLQQGDCRIMRHWTAGRRNSCFRERKGVSPQLTTIAPLTWS
jgi:hypothetical protein